MSLTRPEGVFLTVFMLFALIYFQGFQEARGVLCPTAFLFFLIWQFKM